MELTQDVPQWKKELILKKRNVQQTGKANARYIEYEKSARKTREGNSSNATPVQVGLVSRTAALFQHASYRRSNSELAIRPDYSEFTHVQSDVVVVIEEQRSASEMKEPASVNDRSRRAKSNGMQPNTEWNKRVFRAQSHESMIRGKDGEQSDSSVEYEYGPGIVNRLRNKWEFINNTCRQGKDIKRPALASIWRANSVDNGLNTDKSETFERENGVYKPNGVEERSLSNGDAENGMKKAQSIEAISFTNEGHHVESKNKLCKDTGVDRILSNDNIVIVDNSGKPPKSSRAEMKRASISACSMTEKEIPAHTVRLLQRKFEPNSPRRFSRKGSDSNLVVGKKLSSSTGNLVYKPSIPFPKERTPVNPVRKISPVKPVSTGNRDGPIYPKISKKPFLPEKPKLPLKTGSAMLKSPSHTKRHGLSNGQLSSDGESYPSSEDDVFGSDTSVGAIRISRADVDNIAGESVSQKYDFSKQSNGVTVKNHLPGVTRDPCSQDEADKSIPESAIPQRWIGVPVSEKPVAPKIGVVEPILKVTTVQQENEKNILMNQEPVKELKQGSCEEDLKKPKPIQKPAPKLLPKRQAQAPVGPPRPSRKWHQDTPNTTVIDFTKDDSKKTPDYINNFSRRGIVHIGGATSSDTADEELLRRPPSPCTVEFTNAPVIINGKSSFKNIPRTERLKVNFNDKATETFEYPSEKSWTEVSPDTSPSAKSPQTLNTSIGELSSYIPSKHHVQQFELGTTRSSPKQKPQPKSSEENQSTTPDFLKPANDGSQWSDAVSSDMLF